LVYTKNNILECADLCFIIILQTKILKMKHWINQINQTTTDFKAIFGTLTKDELNWKPNPETWSIAQNIDHLIVINQSYFPLLTDLKTGKFKRPFMARFGFIVSFLGKMILNTVKPETKKKIKTFAIWEPTESKISGDIINQFSNHQDQLKQEMEATKNLIKQGAVISSPANKNIVYSLETAFDIITTHELRHLEQAKEVLALLRKEAVA